MDEQPAIKEPPRICGGFCTDLNNRFFYLFLPKMFPALPDRKRFSLRLFRRLLRSALGPLEPHLFGDGIKRAEGARQSETRMKLLHPRVRIGGQRRAHRSELAFGQLRFSPAMVEIHIDVSRFLIALQQTINCPAGHFVPSRQIRRPFAVRVRFDDTSPGSGAEPVSRVHAMPPSVLYIKSPRTAGAFECVL